MRTSAASDVILRGILARRLVSVTMFVLSSLVAAGTVVAVGFARLTDVSPGSAGSLVLLGFVAIAAQSVESVRRREPELALARLRGRRGLSLIWFVVAEPCVVLVGGAVVGLGVGSLVGRAVVGAWLPRGTTFRLDGTMVAAVGAVTLGGIVLVLATSWGVVRAPLAQQIVGARRPRATSAVGLFQQVVLVLGAVVAVYQAHQAARSRVDWVTLVSPALVGLAAGQVVVWLMLALLAGVVPRTAGSGLGWFITSRRLLRRVDSLALVKMVVAAGVVAGVAASAFTVAQGWREERARLQIGAPVSYRVPGGALAAYAAAHAADPQGRWLLPIARYTADSEPANRRVFVDSSRWSVVGDFFHGTSVEPLAGVLAKFPPPTAVDYLRGSRLTADIGSSSLRRAVDLVLNVQYVNGADDLVLGSLHLRAADGTTPAPGITRFTVPLHRCQLACRVSEIQLNGSSAQPVVITNLVFAGRRLLDPSSGIQLVTHGGERAARLGTGLAVTLPGWRYQGAGTIASFHGPSSRTDAVTTWRLARGTDGSPTVPGVDGSPIPVSIVARMRVLPFVGTSGSVLDLSRALAGASGGIPATAAVILSRADTPASVIDALRATSAVGAPTTYSEMLSRLGRAPRAEGTRLYALTAAFAALIALVSIASSVAQQVRERRVEAASLRSVGIDATTIVSAYRREALVLAGAAFAGTGAAAWLSCWALLPALPLVSGWVFAPPLDLTPDPLLIGPTALVAAATVAAVTYAAVRGIGRSAPPRLLREDLP